MTNKNDIVLIHIKNKPAIFARVEQISPDSKPEWFKVKLMLLQIPISVITWILKSNYINGKEFTLGGENIRLEKIVCPDNNNIHKKSSQTSHNNVIPLFDN